MAAAQYGPHRWSAGEYDSDHTDAFSGARFTVAELDRRHPERVQLRGMRTADDHRAMWNTFERLWSDAVTRAERLPEAARHQRVHDEWSFVETLRHLVFVTDRIGLNGLVLKRRTG